MLYFIRFEYIYINKIRQNEELKHDIQYEIYFYFYPKQIRINPLFSLLYNLQKKIFWIKSDFNIHSNIYTYN